MAISLKLLTILLLIIGGIWASAANPDGVVSYQAGDYGGALASAAVRFIPFAIAARWAWNSATGRKTSWTIKVILAVWVLAWVVQNGRTS